MEKMPVFVKVEEYEDVMRTVNSLKSKIESAKGTLLKINQLKSEEDSQLETWHTALAEIEDRLHAISQLLHEPEQF
ncbi:MAG: hypothetical protein ABIA37_00525 [Candidatus Woesearchaeota archaeon]